jgi:hypothetical protein
LPGFASEAVTALNPQAFAGGKHVVVQVAVARQPHAARLHRDPTIAGGHPAPRSRQGQARGLLEFGQGEGAEGMRGHHQSPVGRETFPMACIMRGDAGLHQCFRGPRLITLRHE